jgi:hypothetical protein
MIISSTIAGHGYNPLYLSVKSPGSDVCLVSAAEIQRPSAFLNILFSAVVIVLSLSVLTSIVELHLQTMTTLLILSFVRVIYVVNKRASGERLVRSKVKTAKFQLSIFTVEWIMVTAATFFLISAIRLGTNPVVIEGLLFAASSAMALLLFIPCLQASLIGLRALGR